jgi:hypothetical protein
MQIPFEIVQFLIFTIPGFFGVWSFRKANDSKQISDFEYLMFSVFWGIILLGFFGWVVSKEMLTKALENLYSACIIFSLFSIFFGSIFGQINKERHLFHAIYSKLLNWIKRNK